MAGKIEASAPHIGEVHIVVVTGGVVAVGSPGVAAPAPAVLSKDTHHRAARGDGVGIHPRLPAGAHQDLSIPDLIVFVGIDVDGGAAVVLAGGALHIAEGAGGVDGELLRVVVDLGKDLFYIFGNGGVDLKSGGGGLFHPAGQRPNRYGDGGYSGLRLGLAVKAALVGGAEEQLAFGRVLPQLGEPEGLGPVVVKAGRSVLYLVPERLFLPLGLGHGAVFHIVGGAGGGHGVDRPKPFKDIVLGGILL